MFIFDEGSNPNVRYDDVDNGGAGAVTHEITTLNISSLKSNEPELTSSDQPIASDSTSSKKSKSKASKHKKHKKKRSTKESDEAQDEPEEEEEYVLVDWDK